jgi:hypothetical protein
LLCRRPLIFATGRRQRSSATSFAIDNSKAFFLSPKEPRWLRSSRPQLPADQVSDARIAVAEQSTRTIRDLATFFHAIAKATLATDAQTRGAARERSRAIRKAAPNTTRLELRPGQK